MKKDVVRKKLKEFIQLELVNDKDYKVSNETSLFKSSLIDSFSLAQIGVFIEMEFDLYIADADLTLDKMDTINQIADEIVSRLNARESR